MTMKQTPFLIIGNCPSLVIGGSITYVKNPAQGHFSSYLYTHLDALLMNQEFTSGASDGVHRDLP